MGTVNDIQKAKFSIGELVHHRLFNYRGVIVDVDYKFKSTDEWYDLVARSRPPKNKPWYHVLVHDQEHSTYVAEKNLEADQDSSPIKHPALNQLFTSFDNGRYVKSDPVN
ncbi:MAG: heat shock protein HspQ [Pseudomonadales bacterium]